MSGKANVTVSVGGDVSDLSEAMRKASEDYKAFEEVLKQGRATFEATRTAAERYEAEIARLGNQLRQGAISQDTYNRAAKQATTAYNENAMATSKVASLTRSALPAMGGMGNSLAQLGPAGLGAAAALSVVAVQVSATIKAVGLLSDVVLSAMERINALDDAARNLGTSAESLSTLRFAATSTGAAAEDLDTGFGKMLQTLAKAATEGGKSAEVFKRLGLNAVELANMRPEDAYRKIGDAISGIKNPAERAQAAVDVFGKTGIKLLGTFGEAGREAEDRARRLGIAISDIDAAKVAAANNSLSDLKAVAQGAGNQLAAQLAPAINEVATSLLALVENYGGLANITRTAVGLAELHVAALINLAHAAKAAATLNPVEGIQAAQGKFGMDFLKRMEELRKQTEERAKAQAEQRRQEQEGIRVAQEDAKAQEDLAESLAKVRREFEQIGMTDAQKKLDDLRKQFGEGPLTQADSDKLAEAESQLNAIEKAKADAKAAEELKRKAEADSKRLQDELDRVRKEGATAGMSDIDKRLFDLKESGADDTQLDQARKSLEQAEAAKKAAKQQEAARKETERLAAEAQKLTINSDPAKKYNEAVADANKLLNEGLIDAVTHQQALAKAAEDYKNEMMKAAGNPPLLEQGSQAALKFLDNIRAKAAIQLPLAQPNLAPPPGEAPGPNGFAPAAQPGAAKSPADLAREQLNKNLGKPLPPPAGFTFMDSAALNGPPAGFSFMDPAALDQLNVNRARSALDAARAGQGLSPRTPGLTTDAQKERDFLERSRNALSRGQAGIQAAEAASARGTRGEDGTKKIEENTGKSADRLEAIKNGIDKLASKFEQPEVVSIL